MTREGVEKKCNSRTHFDLRLHAEKAAFEGQTIRTFFNSLQARTSHKLSPETRLFAEVCYEKKLISCVSTALIECARSEEGREKAREISSQFEEMNSLRNTWKPLVDHCSHLLRELKLEATNARLSRLSDHWDMSTGGSEQANRLKEVVERVLLHNSVGRANHLCDEILDWVELNSIPDSTMQEKYWMGKDHSASGVDRSMVVVEKSETFREAEAFLWREVDTYCADIHVIVGNKDDGVRFYKRIVERFSSYGVQLVWRGKVYGQRISPKIVIGSLEYFRSQYSLTMSPVPASAVILHCESNLKESLDCRFKEGTLDDYLTELFVLTTITMKHFDEIHELVASSRHKDVPRLIESWPCENQVLDACYLASMWTKRSTSYSSRVNRFIEDLQSYTHKSIEDRMKKFMVPSNLKGYVEKHCYEFVQSSIAALALEFGQDYVVYSERSSGSLSLKIRVKKNLSEGSFGLLQFLEMKHGCAMTSYRVPVHTVFTSQFIQRYSRVLIVQRSNPIRIPLNNSLLKDFISLPTTRERPRKPKHSESSVNKFPKIITVDATDLKNCLMIVVCSTRQLLMETFCTLKEAKDVNACVCETPLGVMNESAKNSSGTLVVCTSSVCFEGWTFIPNTRDRLRVYVYHHREDVTALEVACDLANSIEVERFTCDMDKMKQLKIEREWSLWVNPFTKVFTYFNNYREPEISEQYTTHCQIDDLIRAKRLLHKRLQRIYTTVKVVIAGLPARMIESIDSPMDISCQGFLEVAREKMRVALREKEEVEEELSSQAIKWSGLYETNIDEIEVKEIARRHKINAEELDFFVRIFDKPVDWSELRDNIAHNFILEEDAERHWDMCYDRSKADSRMIAFSSECLSNATTFLHNLRRVPWSDNYREFILQRSDRHLEDCIMYYPESGLDEEGLLTIEGSSVEYAAHSSTASVFRGFSKTELLDSVVVESSDRQCPLYLFPRRCYDRLTRDIFDSGLIICSDYVHAESQMHKNDTIQLPLIIETTERSPLERTLRVESSMMEFGSLQWMEWMARRLRYHNYNSEVVAFYHRSIAERDYCVQDDILIERLGMALTNSNLKKASWSVEKMKLDAFVYSTMDSLHRGERLVEINPPSICEDSLLQLTHFVRSRRMPPP